MKCLAAAGLIAFALISSAPLVSAQVPNPVLSGPISGGARGQAFGAMDPADLVEAGYIEQEYFFEGTASSYDRVGTWTANGFWPAAPTGAASYRVRMLVRLPADAQKFNGIVVVEWLNVTTLAEGAADFSQMQEEILRRGYGWVGVGAQASGVNSVVGLKAWDPIRYGSLVHPGDRFSYDIFSQAAQAITDPQGIDPIALPLKALLATGRSQSAFRLVTYINAIHPLVDVFDGFLIHSRGVSAAGLRAEQLAGDTPVPIPPAARLRTDLNVPVLDVQTEGDMTALRSHLTRQTPTASYRRWEIAGAAHAETPRWLVEVPPPLDFGPACAVAVNAAPHHAVVKAALRALTEWVVSGITPPQSDDIQLANPTAVTATIVRDAFGNALGGIRLPELEVPTATLDGRINSPAVPPPPGGANFCFLFGGTVPFSDSTLDALYRNHGAFVSRFNRAVEAIVRQGFWLEPEGEQARIAAAHSGIGK